MNKISKINVGAITLPDDSSTYSMQLSAKLVTISSGHLKENTEALLGTAGFEVLLACNFDKGAEDLSHTCAYTVAKGDVTLNGAQREAIMIVVRGTGDGEWYSNFDFSAAQDDSSTFADNFLYAAEDVFMGAKDYIDESEDPLIIVTGHSRGAACANLLGVLLTESYGSENVYAYTFATPNTVKADSFDNIYTNIFNLINPNDIVPELPLHSWGYERAGVDIVLGTTDEAFAKKIQNAAEVIYEIAPTVTQYYSERHSITSKGLSDEGITPFDLCMLLCSTLTKSTESFMKEDDSAESGLSLDADTLSLLFADNDFSSLSALVLKLVHNNFETGKKLLEEHLGTKYLELILAS